jgi:hypothetical protein
MRQALTLAINHAPSRMAFGKRMAALPMPTNILANLALDSEAALLTDLAVPFSRCAPMAAPDHYAPRPQRGAGRRPDGRQGCYGGCLAPHSHLRGSVIPTPRQ